MASGFELWDEETTLTWHKDEGRAAAPKPLAPPTLRGVGPARRAAGAAASEQMPSSMTKTGVWDAVAYWDSTERKTSPGGRDAAAAFEIARSAPQSGRPAVEDLHERAPYPPEPHDAYAHAEWIEAESIEPSEEEAGPRESGERGRLGEAASRGLWWAGITLVTVGLLAMTVAAPALG